MVKGKNHTVPLKPQLSKRVTGKNSVQTPTNKSVAGTTVKMLPQAMVPSCSGCGKIVTEETQALQCDKCMSNNSWKCAECLNLTADAYDCLVSDTVVSIRWFCDNCDRKVMDTNEVSEGQSSKIDHLIGVIEKLVCRYEDIERKLDSKPSVEEVSKLELRITQLEERMQKQDTDIDSKLNSFEDQLKASAEFTDKDQAVSDEDMIKCVVKDMRFKDCIEKAVEARCVEDTAEKNEREKRKTSVIIHGVAESSSTDAKDREDDDTGVVASMLYEIKCDEVQVNSVIRLGRRSLSTNTDEQIKPRPN